ncbi:MAG: transcriptional regulator [Pseudonocardiales bacterium]|nr:MAG: transcriptional regulator [Pseudonocardiales bacterium]
MPKRLTPLDLSIGERIRARRQLRGWSLRQAADRAGIHYATLSRIERGLASADNRFVLADIAAGLDCSVAELTGAPSTSTDANVIAARASVAAIRRSLVEADFAMPSTCTPRPTRQLEREVELVRALQTDLNYAGAGQYVPRLVRELHAAAAGPDRTTALRLAVFTGDVIVAMAKTTGYPADAWLAAEWAWQAAEALADPVLLGFAAWSRTHAATGCGGYERAHALATRAADELQGHLSAPDALPMLGLLLLTSAHTAYATKRKSQGADTYAEADRVAVRTGETTTFDQFFGPTNVAFWRVGSEVDGGNPDRAVQIVHATNPEVLAVPIRRVMFHLDASRALMHVRRDQEAIRHLLTAERAGPQVIRPSPIAAETARNLLDRARRRAGGTELRGLCERLGVARR